MNISGIDVIILFSISLILLRIPFILLDIDSNSNFEISLFEFDKVIYHLKSTTYSWIRDPLL